eukprot:1178040-Prorocentrum_minimum.AAC.3
MHGVDATALHANRDLMLGFVSLPYTTVRWNFPFCGVDENNAIHTTLYAPVPCRPCTKSNK